MGSYSMMRAMLQSMDLVVLIVDGSMVSNTMGAMSNVVILGGDLDVMCAVVMRIVVYWSSVEGLVVWHNSVRSRVWNM